MSSGRSMTKKKAARILVADDDREFLRAVERILVQVGYDVSTASNGAEAIAILEANSFDLIIADLRMPTADGLELLQDIRRRGLKVPVLLVTAFGEVESYLEAMTEGAFDYLTKPVACEELMRLVESALASAHELGANPPRREAEFTPASRTQKS